MLSTIMLASLCLRGFGTSLDQARALVHRPAQKGGSAGRKDSGGGSRRKTVPADAPQQSLDVLLRNHLVPQPGGSSPAHDVDALAQVAVPLALFPPPSMTPRTASMPRSPLRLASLRVSFVVESLASRPSSLAPKAWLWLSRVCLALSPRSTPSPPVPRMWLPRTTVPTTWTSKPALIASPSVSRTELPEIALRSPPPTSIATASPRPGWRR